MELVRVSILPAETESMIEISALPDTGAQIDAIPTSLFQDSFPTMQSTPWENNTVTATGEQIDNLGFFKANIGWQSGNDVREVTTNFHVLTDLRQPIISKDTQRRLGMLPTGYPNQVFHVHATEDAGPSEAQKQADLQKLIAEFPQICDGVCRPMAGPPCHFELKPDAIPMAIRGSRPVAEPLLPRLKAELDSLEKQNIIRKVIEPTAWVHPIVIVLKKDGGVRVCGDFTILNKSIIRPKFDTATPFQAVRTIPPGMKFFTVIDALKGYHQVLLDDESAALTTFSTPFRRYQYLRLPFA